MSQDLSYRLDIARKSLASTVAPDGGVELAREAVVELLELLEAAGAAVSELARLRKGLLAVINDPVHRTMTIPLREVAALLQSR